MADQSTGGLDQLTTAMLHTDEFVINNLTTNETERILRNLALNLEYGNIYIDNGITNQTTNATPNTFDIVTGFNTAQGVNGLSSANITPDKANNRITVNATGVYTVSCSCSFTGTSTTVFDLDVFVNGVVQPAIRLSRKIGTGSDIGNSSMEGLVTIGTIGHNIDVRVASDGSSDTFTPKYMSLSIVRIST